MIEMRRSLAFGFSLVILLAAVVLAWNHRYEAIPGSEVLTLEQVKSKTPGQTGVQWKVADGKPILQLTKAAGDSSVVLKVPLPAPAGCSGMHLRYTLQAHNLKGGRNDWDDGRLNVTWMTSDQCQIQQVASVRNNLKTSSPSMISVAPNGGIEPQLSIEHLGVSGDYEISELEIVFVREKAWWAVVCGILIAASGGWILLTLRTLTQVNALRIFAASAITMMLMLMLVIPGPWLSQKPLIAESFELGSCKDTKADPGKSMVAPDFVAEQAVAPPLVTPILPESLSESSTGSPQTKPTVQRTTVIQQNWILWIKIKLKHFKIVLHGLLFTAVLFVMSGLIGLRPAVYVSIFLALATEVAQLAFGYGSDATDILDLLFDAMGISAGVWLVMLVNKRRPSLMKLWARE